MSEPRRPTRTRRRPAFSCDECRRRKIKCDRTQPCRHCGQSNAACKYAEGAAPLNHQNAPAASPHRRIAPPTPISITSTGPSSSLGDLSISGGGDERLQPSLQQSWKAPNTNKENGEDSPKVRALFEKVQRLEQLLSEYMPDEGPGNSSPPKSTEPATAQLRGTLSKTRFFGSSHWMNLVGLVRLSRKSFFTQISTDSRSLILLQPRQVLRQFQRLASAKAS